MPDTSKTSKTIQIDPRSALGQLIEDEAETGPLLEKDGVRYRLVRVGAPTPPSDIRNQPTPLAPDRLLNIIGIGASEGESDIAHFKHQYIADATANRGE